MRRVMGLEALARVEARRRARDPETTADAAARVDDLRRQMAELAIAIKALEERAAQLNAAPSAEDAAEQVQVIDGLLEGVRTMRASLDQQREDLMVAERRAQDAEGQPGGGDAEAPHPHADTTDA